MLQFKDSTTGKLVHAKPEKDIGEQIGRLKSGLEDVATKADNTEGQVLETGRQVDVALTGITELYTDQVRTKENLALAESTLAEAKKLAQDATGQVKVLLKANAELIDDNNKLVEALKVANKRLDETNIELKDAGDALIEMFMMIMYMQK